MTGNGERCTRRSINFVFEIGGGSEDVLIPCIGGNHAVDAVGLNALTFQEGNGMSSECSYKSMKGEVFSRLVNSCCP